MAAASTHTLEEIRSYLDAESLAKVIENAR